MSGSFPPTLRYQKREIHTVFRRFRYLDWTKNLSLTALADLIGGSLIKAENKKGMITMQTMKRLLAFALALTMVFALSA